MRAPWRWHWGRILALLAQCAGWAGALQWSPFFGIPCALWVAMNIRAGYTEPRSPTADTTPLQGEEADHRREVKFNGAQTTYTPPLTERHHQSV